MNGFRGDLRRLTEQSGAFEEHAATARGIAAELREALERTGDCWGTDEAGTRFAELHLPGARRALDTVDELSERLGALGGKFAHTAEEYDRADEDASARLRAVDGAQRGRE
ncbi:hypothetical protein [Actinopolyspora mortivallis]|uniref:Uncharacterized protein n=1 Tax=Actinopolyspora mortivallis TaxID=33906 RepID=A0A2T0GTU3_ACTMO|nr:hypothetical protein [Actinopolyspora mortivallis]PRW62453.1 hypothetical protein CEP50_15575 [Actinopolyspora mortivallis]